MDKTATKFYAEKIRKDRPEFKSLSDNEVLTVVRQVEAQDATDEEWAAALASVHGAAPKQKGIPTEALVTGAVGIGLGALAVKAHMKGKAEFERTPGLGRPPEISGGGIPPEVKASIERMKGSTPQTPPIQPQVSPKTPVQTGEIQPKEPIIPGKPAEDLVAQMGEPPASGKLPDYLSEEMRSRGQNPNRIMNEVDAAQSRDLLKTDPLIEKIRASNPELAERAARGDITREELAPFLKGPALLEQSRGAEPPAVSSRATHQFDPVNAHAARKLEQDPAYFSRLVELEGGRTVTHAETWDTAFKLPSMTIDELGSWHARKPVSELDEARAAILRTYWWDKYQGALRNNEPEIAESAYKVLSVIEPGYHNLSGTPGRALNFQKVYNFQEEVRTQLMELQRRNTPFATMRTRAEEILRDAEAKNKLSSEPSAFRKVVDAVEDFATAMKLTSPVTHLVNTTSNTITFLTRATEKTVAAGILKASGQHTDAAAEIKYAFGTSQGWSSATRKFLNELVVDFPSNFGKTERRPRAEGAVNKVPKSLRPLSPFRWLAAADSFWKTIIYDSELYTKAYMAAADEGKVGLDLARRVEELRLGPLDEWKESARLQSLEHTFQEDPDFLLRGLQYLQNFPGVRLVVPFVQTPYNIMRYYSRRSIFGIASPKFYKDIHAGGVRRAEAMGRLGVGLGLTGGALAVMANGQVTAGYPKNPKERALWIQEHRRPWSIRIGDYWFTYSRIQPIGSYLMTVSAVKAAYDENKFEKAKSKLGKAISQVLHGPLDLPFLQGMSALFDAMQDPERYSEQVLQLAVTGVLPNFLRDIRSQMDPTERKPETIEEAIKVMLPGRSEEVPKRVTVLGENQQAAPSKILRATKMFTNITEDERTNLMREIGWVPPMAEATLSFQGTDLELTGKEKEQFLTDMGSAADAAVKYAMANPTFQGRSPAEKKKILSILTERLQSHLRKIYIAKSGLAGEEQKGKSAGKLEAFNAKIAETKVGGPEPSTE